MRKNFLSILVMGLVFVLSGSVFASPVQSQTKTTTIRIGILGDSNSDEYRADDSRAGGTPYEATTLNWVELLAKYRNIDFGAWGNWGGVRRTGFEYNWARSGATAESMIADGQHTGLAEQIKAGKIDYAIIFIGANDFHSWNGTYEEVYSGKLSDKQLQAKIDGIVSNITLAVDTLQAAGNVKIVLTNYSDPNASADFLLSYPEKNKRQRISDAIIQIDKRLAELASDRGLILADLYNVSSVLLSRVDNGNIMVGGQAINAVVHGDEPHHLQLESGVGHLGTVGSGILANFFLAALPSDNMSIPQFTDEEILANAGINSADSASADTLRQGVDAFKAIVESLLGQ